MTKHGKTIVHDAPINLRVIIRITLTGYWMLLSKLWLTYKCDIEVNALLSVKNIAFTKTKQSSQR